MGLSNYTAIGIVKDYGEYLEDLFYSLPSEYTLEQISYSRWAISELLNQLTSCSSNSELLVMENLSDKFGEFSHYSSDKHIFSIAQEIVNNAIDLFISQ